MTELEGSGGGAVGKIWRKHGGGYYALVAVGTFVYMEIRSFVESFMGSDNVQDFLMSELLQFGVETILNSFMAGAWPFMWMNWMGWQEAAIYAGAGYLVWALILAMLLNRREQELKKELGL